MPTSGLTGPLLSGGTLSFSVSGTAEGLSFTFTVTNASVTVSGTAVFSGPASLTLAGSSPDTGTFSASGSVANISAGNVTVPFTTTLGHGTITGAMTFPETALVNSGQRRGHDHGRNRQLCRLYQLGLNGVRHDRGLRAFRRDVQLLGFRHGQYQRCRRASRHFRGYAGSGAYGSGAYSYDILGPTGTSLGYKTVAAKPGDVVELYGIGFGPTNPAVPSGRAYTGPPGVATDSITITINGTPVTPSFAGVVVPGLFQFNLTVPAGLGSGDQPLLASVNGMSTQNGVAFALQ